MNKIILASASPRRRELLQQIGIEFTVIPATGEERLPERGADGTADRAPERSGNHSADCNANHSMDCGANPGADCSVNCRERGPAPWKIVEALSAQKAGEVFGGLSEEKRESSIVVGADTVVVLEDEVMGKPGSRKEAGAMLSRLQGSSHQVYTGVTLIKGEGQSEPPRIVTFHEKTEVVMYPMSEAEINAYVDTGEPMDKAGAYGIQGKCAAFIREIHGDYNNVVGLPTGRLYQELKKLQCL